MCIICIDLEKGVLSPWEARSNLGEMFEKLGAEHVRKVDKIISKMIHEEINLAYGETIQDTLDLCDSCEPWSCRCDAAYT